MTPEVSALLETELRGDEGEKLKVYDDATGKPIGPGTVVKGWPTIAVGRNLVARGLRVKESQFMLDNDRDELEADLAPRLPWLTQQTPRRQCVVYSLYFNTGLGSPDHFVQQGWPHFLAQLQAGQYEAAAQNLETSQPWATQVGPRAKRLADFVRYG